MLESMEAWTELVWPLSAQSMPTWVAFMVVLATIFVWEFFLKKGPKGQLHEEEKKCDAIVRTMDALLDYMEARDAKEANGEECEDGLPEASRVLELLWDDVHEVRTTEYGIKEDDPRNKKVEELLKRLVKNELEEAVRVTKQAQAIAKGEEDAASAGSEEDLKEVMEFWSGEKLEEMIDFVKKKVSKHMGPEYVDEESLASAKALLKLLRKTQRKNMHALLSLILPCVPNIIFSTVVCSLQVMLQMVFHQIGYWMTPIEAAVKGEWDNVRLQLLRIFFGHVVIDFLGMIQESFIAKSEASLCQNVKNGVLKCMLHQDYEYFDKNPPGVLQERLNRDADMLGQNVIHYPQQILTMGIRIVSGLLFVYQTCPRDMFLMAVMPLVPVIVLQYYLVKYFNRTDERIRRLEESAASSTSEVLREIKTVRQFAMESQEAAKYAFSSSLCQEVVQDVSIRRNMAGILFGLSIYGGLVLTVWMGAQRVAAGEMTMSGLMDTTFKLNFTVVFTLRELIEQLPKASKLMQPLGRISELLQSNPRIEPKGDETVGLRPERFSGLIEFEDVEFAYPKDPRKQVLQGLSFTVEPGQKVALIGHTGCGKSSTMSLLQRLYQPQKGSIRIDGKDIKEYDIRYLRSRIVIVDQFTVLFATSVRENITYGMGNVDDQELEQACRDAACWDFLQEKPDKLMTEVQVGGSNFSGGQRQRIAIARAIVRKPDVILLDEATASLDAENERLVQGALDLLAKKGSALVIAHRLSTIKDSDKIVVIDHGRKVEEGTHDKLLGTTAVPEESEATNDESPVAPSPSFLERATSDTTPSHSHSKDDLDLKTSAVPGPPKLSLNRMKTFHGVTVAPTDAGHVTYRKLWDAATGTQEKMTVHQMQQKIDKMEGELASLKSRVSSIRALTAPLLETTDKVRGKENRPMGRLSRATSSLAAPEPGQPQAPAKLDISRSGSSSGSGRQVSGGAS